MTWHSAHSGQIAATKGRWWQHATRVGAGVMCGAAGCGSKLCAWPWAPHALPGAGLPAAHTCLPLKAFCRYRRLHRFMAGHLVTCRGGQRGPCIAFLPHPSGPDAVQPCPFCPLRSASSPCQPWQHIAAPPLRCPPRAIHRPATQAHPRGSHPAACDLLPGPVRRAAGPGRRAAGGQPQRTTSVRITGRLGRSYCSRNSSRLSPARRSMLSTSSQAGSTAAVAQLPGGMGQGRRGRDDQEKLREVQGSSPASCAALWQL